MANTFIDKFIHCATINNQVWLTTLSYIPEIEYDRIRGISDDKYIESTIEELSSTYHINVKLLTAIRNFLHQGVVSFPHLGTTTQIDFYNKDFIATFLQHADKINKQWQEDLKINAILCNIFNGVSEDVFLKFSAENLKSIGFDDKQLDALYKFSRCGVLSIPKTINFFSDFCEEAKKKNMKWFNNLGFNLEDNPLNKLSKDDFLQCNFNSLESEYKLNNKQIVALYDFASNGKDGIPFIEQPFDDIINYAIDEICGTTEIFKRHRLIELYGYILRKKGIVIYSVNISHQSYYTYYYFEEEFRKRYEPFLKLYTIESLGTLFVEHKDIKYLHVLRDCYKGALECYNTKINKIVGY
jgi:hypothetical protein